MAATPLVLQDRHDRNDDRTEPAILGATAIVMGSSAREGKGTFGYNAATGEYGDVIELGILNPTKVTRLALQNSASVAALFLATEASIAELPKEESHTHAVPGGGMDM